MKANKKPKRKPRPARVQKKRTETIQEMIELATGKKPKNMRGQHFKFERRDLRESILRIYKENPKDFYNKSGKFIIVSLLERVESYFEHDKIKREDFYASNEKAIKEEIKNLLKSKKINKMLES